MFLVLREVTVRTVTATGEVISNEVTFPRTIGACGRTCSFSFEEDGVTHTVTGGFLLRGPAAT